MPLQPFQRFRRGWLTVLKPGCELVGDGCVYRLQAAQPRIQFRSHHEVRVLSREQINSDERHRYHQHHRNHTNEHVGDDQPVAQPPQQSRFQPAVRQNRQQNDDKKTEDAYPSAERLTPGNLPPPEQFLRRKEQQVEAEKVAGGAGQPGARQQAGRLQSKTQGAEGKLHDERGL